MLVVGVGAIQSVGAAAATATAEAPLVIRTLTAGVSKGLNYAPTVAGGLFVAEQIPSVAAQQGAYNKSQTIGALAPGFIAFYEGAKSTQGIGEKVFTRPINIPTGKPNQQGIVDTITTRQFKPEITKEVKGLLESRRGEVGGRSAKERSGSITKAELRQRKSQQQQPFKLEKEQLAQNEALYTLRGKGVERLIRKGEVVPTQALKTQQEGGGVSLDVVQVKFRQEGGRVELTSERVPQRPAVFDLNNVERTVPVRLLKAQEYTSLQEQSVNSQLVQQRQRQVKNLLDLFKNNKPNNELVQPTGTSTIQEPPGAVRRIIPRSPYVTTGNVRTLYPEVKTQRNNYLQRGVRNPRETAALERLRAAGARRQEQIRGQLPAIDRTVQGVPTIQERSTTVSFVEEVTGQGIQTGGLKKKRGFGQNQFQGLGSAQGNDFKVILLNKQESKQVTRQAQSTEQFTSQAQQPALAFIVEQQPAQLATQDVFQEQATEQQKEQITIQKSTFNFSPTQQFKEPGNPSTREPRPELPRGPFREPPNRTRIPRTREPPTEELPPVTPFGTKGKKKREELYDVYAKRFDKYYRASNQGLRLTEAAARGQEITDTTLAASFLVSPKDTGLPVSGSQKKRLFELVNKERFTTSKKDTNVLVEKPRYRLSTPTETLELQQAKKKKQRGIFGG